MLVTRTEKRFWREDNGVKFGSGSERREYKQVTYWFLFLPVYTSFRIVSKAS